jgi:translation initiation factor IF-2
MRIHELAKELQISSHELIDKMLASGFKVKGHMSTVPKEALLLFKKRIRKLKPKKKKELKAKPRTKPRGRPRKKPEALVKPQTAIKKELKGTSIVTPLPPKEEEKTLVKEIEIDIPITVKELSVKLQEKPNVIISKLMKLGMMTTINQSLDEAMIQKIASALDFKYKKALTDEEILIEEHKTEQDKALLSPRPPVVTFMGHVDHGKTSLLDTIRKSKITEKEHGGITQHMGAYEVEIDKGKITFLDTPGHEAFTAMRARGANITDLVVLVVAADEGVMPQTIEAIDHARAAGVPIVVAINKIDKPQADIDKVKKQLSTLDLTAEDWGGKTVTVGVSAKTGEGIDHLLEMILLEAELLELKANYKKRASGVVVEARLTKDKGPIATLIIQNGTLRKADIVIAGTHYGRIKALLNDKEEPIEEATPGTPVEILGLSGLPEAGEQFLTTDDERKAKDICFRRQMLKKERESRPIRRVSLEDLYSQVKEGKIKELRIILKADVQGSLEALKDSFEKLATREVKLLTIHSGIGSINNSDIILAAASDAVVIGFHVGIEPQAKEIADRERVDVRTYRIIYDATNDMKAALEGMLEPKIKKKFQGRIEIRQIFKLSKTGIVAGCFVQKGKVTRNSYAEVIRNGEVVYEGEISSLKRFKDDVREVTEGYECGLTLSNYQDYKQGDIIQVYEIEKIVRKLKES